MSLWIASIAAGLAVIAAGLAVRAYRRIWKATKLGEDDGAQVRADADPG